MEFPSTTTAHLNSKVRHFGGFVPRRRVFGRGPKMPIGTVFSLNFEDFVNPKDAQWTKTHHLLGIITELEENRRREILAGIKFARK